MRSTQQTYSNALHTLINPMDKSSLGRYGANLVSEIVYDPQNPFTLHLLLPFLQQLGQQPRWQLWLSPERRLNRYWINSLGLPEKKTVALNTTSIEMSVEMIEKALKSGNFSSVIAWLPSMAPNVKEKLRQAAVDGDCYCFILQPLSANQGQFYQPDLFNRAHWH